ncbi:cytochrome c/c1 heme-lyase [Sporodiniella umbellata]|nr:cytochrome c/c1 heme-lyase [Sporodiniella umbellata]
MSDNTEELKCPVDHNSYKHFVSPGQVQVSSEAKEEAKCPVDHSSYQQFVPPKESEPKDACPVDHTVYKHFAPKKEERSSGVMDSSNNMPTVSEQHRQPDQKGPLSLDREVSTIPRASSDDKMWVYPSEQMFFNAMKRKNWTPNENDMSVVVPIHNAVNEMAWQKILEWEKMHSTECNQPMLLKFEGKPKEVTPKARIRSWFGYTLPFDRHDWVVDRCGEKVTYVIDFYSGKKDPRSPMSLSFYLDVRPAPTPSGIWDRLKMSFRKGEFV